MEIWKDIKGYEGIYKVSDLGRVKSLSRIVLNNGINPFNSKEKILKSGISTNGKLVVSLRINNVAKSYQVHQLVAIAFLGHIPSGNKVVVDHIDNNPINNNLENLQIITQRENASKDRKGYSSEYTGVSLLNHNKKWMATIQIDKKNKNLGVYKTEIEAHKAYQNALKNILCPTL